MDHIGLFLRVEMNFLLLILRAIFLVPRESVDSHSLPVLDRLFPSAPYAPGPPFLFGLSVEL